MKYSLKKGFSKGAVSALTVLASVVAFAGLSDMSIIGLIEEHIYPLLGGLTVGGAITMIINYVKVSAE